MSEVEAETTPLKDNIMEGVTEEAEAKCVLVWTNDMFRMQSHDINQPITVWCKICDGIGGVVVVGTALV